MSSENERPFTVIWVPDMASDTGWSGKRVMLGEAEQQRVRRTRRTMGFQRRETDGRADVE